MQVSKFLERKYSLPLIVLVGILLAASMVALKPGLKQAENLSQVRKVWYIDVKRLPTRARAIGYGEVQPAIALEANAEVAGKVVYVHPELKNGGSINRNERVLQIDTTDYELKISQAKANLEVNKANLENLNVEENNTQVLLEIAKRNYSLGTQELKRKQRLQKQGSLSQSAVDQEQQKLLALQEQVQSLENTLATLPSRRAVINAQIAQAEVQVKEQEKNLERSTVIMPFDGRIGEVWVEVDEFVNAGSKLFDASNIGQVEIQAQLPLKQARPLILGMDPMLLQEHQVPSPKAVLNSLDLDVKIRMVGQMEQAVWEGKVVRIGEGIDHNSRTMPFIVAADSSPGKVKPGERPPLFKGMYTEIEFQGKPVNRIVIPRQAVHQGKIYVATTENTLEIRSITTDFVQGELLIVKQGLEEGERLITTDLVPAVAGMSLDLVKNESLEAEIKALANGEGALK